MSEEKRIRASGLPRGSKIVVYDSSGKVVETWEER